VSHTNQPHPASHAIVLICMAALTLTFASCGKMAPPTAPIRLSERTSELTAIQRGSTVILSWPAPALGQKESSRFYIERADIYRLKETRDQEPVLDPDDFEQSAILVGYLDRAQLESLKQSLGHLEYPDTINLGASKNLANTRLRYAIRYANKREQKAAFSNTVSIEPVARISNPPTDLRVTTEGQDAITLAWTAPEANIDGTQGAAVVGYNLYRRPAKRKSGGELVNSEPISDTAFVDRKFEYKTDYVYSVRALSQGTTGLIESSDGNQLEFTPLDKFPPAPPDPVSIASANATVSLFWPSSPEGDVVGYNVYRASSADVPDSEWLRMTPQPITTVTYRDERVTIDRQYFYKVTAVDRFDNESKPSSAVSEIAHP
jgi:fibronectin type III domain protein